jgi:hypothetical protein
MAGTTQITFAQEGQTPITFEVSASFMDKVYQKIAALNESPVLGVQLSGAADWWMKETADKIIAPLYKEYPDPDPAGVAQCKVEIQNLTAKINDLKAAAVVNPITIIPGV